ncbi:HD domain-containing protein [Lederbergia lenta]|uniref:Metal dependent phosphohydrolase n=1 Tax=Lederbergia lenta TaxID=1467 RepID=A0A2X4YLM9_LEDLE|nr:HD domain-containing protein [Lederbergia lenta]MEC2323510.1 HD domain-containing protein [Lederbergia lenta]SQI52675.1 metal dependent phosphohydrolase [Lederbergia lenta]
MIKRLALKKKVNDIILTKYRKSERQDHMNLIEKATQFAAIKHEGQYRKATKIPYITHPFAVGMILQQEGYGEEIIAAGLLHDTMEDTDTTKEELLQEFGEGVLNLVMAATEQDRSMSWEERKQATVNGLALKTPEQIAVIVADKIHNLRSIRADLDKYGEEIWSRFNRGKQEQAWYYTSIVKAITPFEKEVPFIRKLSIEMDDLFSENRGK